MNFDLAQPRTQNFKSNRHWDYSKRVQLILYHILMCKRDLQSLYAYTFSLLLCLVSLDLYSCLFESLALNWPKLTRFREKIFYRTATKTDRSSICWPTEIKADAIKIKYEFNEAIYQKWTVQCMYGAWE